MIMPAVIQPSRAMSYKRAVSGSYFERMHDYYNCGNVAKLILMWFIMFCPYTTSDVIIMFVFRSKSTAMETVAPGE